MSTLRGWEQFRNFNTLYICFFYATLHRKATKLTLVLGFYMSTNYSSAILLPSLLKLTILFSSVMYTFAIASTVPINDNVAAVSISNNEPYTLKKGESVYTVAKKNGISVTTLRKINQFRSFSKPFLKLTTGDELDVPINPAAIRSVAPTGDKSKDQTLRKTANATVYLADVIAADNSSFAAASAAKGYVQGQVNKSVESLMSPFGTTRVQLNMNDPGRFDGSALDILIPLHDVNDTLMFTQLGVRNKDGRTTLNAGLGGRIDYNNWLLGLNGFYDKDISGKNSRIGVGAEAFRDYMKLSANTYLGLSGWHQSRDFSDYNERPANGYDVRAETFLPFYPSLGGKLMFERYKGNDVALLGKNERQKNPYAFTMGVNYTPFPLLTLGTENKKGKSSKGNTQFTLGLNYRLGESLDKQLSQEAVAATKKLSGSRLGLVDRNNEVVLDYQKQTLLRLTLPTKIGTADSSDLLIANVSSKYPLERIEWDTTNLLAAGGTAEISSVEKTQLHFTYPVYRNVQSLSANTYTVLATAWDVKGNASAPVSTTIISTPRGIVLQHVVEKNNVLANGQDAAKVTVTLTDNHGKPLVGEELLFSAPVGSVLSENKGQSEVMVSERVITPENVEKVMLKVKTNSNGQGQVNITRLQSGDISLFVQFIQGSVTESLDIPLSFKQTLQIADFSVLEDGGIANGISINKVKLLVSDAEEKPIHGVTVTFSATNNAVIADSAITNIQGEIILPLTSFSPGESIVTATLHDNSKQVGVFFVSASPVVLIIKRNDNVLTGAPLVGDELTVKSECINISTNESCPDSNYQWEVETSPYSGIYTAIPGASGSTYTVTREMQRRKLRVTMP
ncbi:inverse autotransporter beta domain-containing protein [Serratia sp. N21D137]|uniref:inverse autotransporter beta domain-containing protein n=1 Tax=Serratia sp. N21D137 TaxID=3397495 RepID=UPI0039DFCB55